jgi:hypothetical protein
VLWISNSPISGSLGIGLYAIFKSCEPTIIVLEYNIPVVVDEFNCSGFCVVGNCKVISVVSPINLTFDVRGKVIFVSTMDLDDFSCVCCIEGSC